VPHRRGGVEAAMAYLTGNARAAPAQAPAVAAHR
jgi:hypothetical protein